MLNKMYKMKNNLKITIIISMIFIFLIVPISFTALSRNLYFIDFNDYLFEEPLSREQLNSHGVQTGNWDNGLEERTLVVPNPKDSEDLVLRVFSPESGVGPGQTGMQVELLLPESQEYYMSYDFMFGDNFSWGSESKGGKLPGITGGKRCGDDFHCDGTDGFAARFMWRKEGLAELYLYDVDNPGEYGRDIPLLNSDGTQVQFNTNQWYNIKERVVMNTGEDYNGIIQVWIDNNLVLDLQGVRLATNGDLIDTFYFSTFHGGSTELWQVEHDSYMYYDSIIISTEPL